MGPLCRAVAGVTCAPSSCEGGQHRARVARRRAVWDTAFSRDPQRKYLYVADGRNQKERIFDRQSMEELTNFGKGGHYPGKWYSLHTIATDSTGNLFTVETYQGRRLQRFLYKGIAPVRAKQQGVLWPQGK